MPTTYAIPNGSTAMAATLYAGSGATQAISNGSNNPTGVSFAPDLVWIRNRTSASGGMLLDTIAGTSVFLQTTNANGNASNSGDFVSFNSNGFSVGANGNLANQTSNNYVGWNWKAGGTAVTNNDGTITSSVSANTTAGFSVVTWTAPASTGTHTVGHGLGVAPSMIITKSRSGGTGGLGWAVYFTTLGNSAGLALNTTANSFSSSNYWGSSNPTSTVFGLNDAASATGYDNNTGNMVAYCFAAVAGYSAFGSYTGNNSNDGPFVYLGFRPRFVMFKDSSTTGAWMIMDTARNTYNVEQNGLAPNNVNAESTYSGTPQVDFLSNGFKIRADNANSYWNNVSGNTYIYAAFAENPFKFSNAR
jgi:hypothetical protein